MKILQELSDYSLVAKNQFMHMAEDHNGEIPTGLAKVNLLIGNVLELEATAEYILKSCLRTDSNKDAY